MEDEGRQLIRYGGSFFVVTFLTKQMGHTQPNDPGNKKEYKPPPPSSGTLERVEQNLTGKEPFACLFIIPPLTLFTS